MKKNIVIVGLGLIGKRHLTASYQVPGMVVSAIVDPSLEVKKFAEEKGFRWFGNLEEMFSSGKPDGIILATPTVLHVKQAELCVEKKCPLLIEKPIAVDAVSAEALVLRAKRDKVPILVGHHRRHNPIVKKAHEIIQSGRLGTLRSAHVTCWFYKPDYYFDEAPWRKKVGAGPISVNLVHEVNLLRHFLGEVVEVKSFASPAIRGYENEDTAVAILGFAGGALATLTVSDSIVSPWSWELTSKENAAYPTTGESCYMIGGSKASLSIPDLRIWEHEGAPDWWTPISCELTNVELSDALVNQLKQFVKVVSGEEEPLVSGEDGLKSLQIVEAIQKNAAGDQG